MNYEIDQIKIFWNENDHILWFHTVLSKYRISELHKSS